MLKQRVLTALIALPLLLGLLIFGPSWGILAFLAAVGIAGWLEYRRIVGGLHPLFFGFGLLCGLALLWSMYTGAYSQGLFIFLAAMTLVGLSAVFLHSREQAVWAQVERTWLGLALIFPPLSAMASFAALDDAGRLYILFLMAVVFAGDTGAYFTGRAWGRSKLCPTISPNKTWAGLWGGLCGGALVGLVGGILDGDPLDLLTGPALGLGLAGLGVVGDLLISMIKRHYQVKDAGSILPGHGGVLDRLDSFILAGPWLFAVWRIWG